MNDREARQRFTKHRTDILSQMMSVLFSCSPSPQKEVKEMNDRFARDHTLPQNAPPEKPCPLFERREEDFDLFDVYQLYTKTAPKRVIAKDKSSYSYLLDRCDEFARRHHGRVTGVVDAQDRCAKISVTVPSFFEFSNEQERFLLKTILERGRDLFFEPSADGGVTMTMVFTYFEEAESFPDFLVKNLPDILTQKGLTLEEIAQRSGVKLEALQELLREQ